MKGSESIPKNKQKIKISYDPLSQRNLPKTQYHFQSCMILACIGDTIGYKNGQWEFQKNGKIIQDCILQKTADLGILALNITKEYPKQSKLINKQSWRYSDDTAMHIATAEGLIQSQEKDSINQTVRKIAVLYKQSLKDMRGRAPGKTTLQFLEKLNQTCSNWTTFPFNEKGWGCGGSMRTACIGLAYHDQKSLKKLVAISIQTTVITHHNPVGFIGSLMASYFTSLAIRRVNPKLWMMHFYKCLNQEAYFYIQNKGINVRQNLGKDWYLSLENIKNYCQRRRIPFNKQTQSIESIEPYFNQKFQDVKQRELEWMGLGFGIKWPGSLGIDSALIAYDSILYSKGNFEEMCRISIVHGGDNDSTATIAGAWYGAYYGMREVPTSFYLEMEGLQGIIKTGRQLFNKYCLKDKQTPFISTSEMIK